jgi:hypothetical protein
MRRFIGALLFLVTPAWLALTLLTERLFKAGILNNKDLSPLVGDETGSLTEYLLNVWHWDAATGLLMLASVPCFFIGVFLFASKSTSQVRFSLRTLLIGMTVIAVLLGLLVAAGPF